MKLVVASSHTNFFDTSEMDVFRDELVQRLRAVGHDVEPLRLPMPAEPHRSLDAIVSTRLLKVANTDVTLSLDFPACCLAGPRKIAWITSDDEPEAAGSILAEALRRSRDHALLEAERVFVGSDILRHQLITSAANALILPRPKGDHAWRATTQRLLS